MSKKDELIAKATEMNLPLTGEETNTVLENMIKDANPNPGLVENTQDNNQPIKNENTAISQNIAPKDAKPEGEAMVPLSKVKELIAEAMANQAEASKPVKVKRVTEHHAHVWRFNGKWVIDFIDRNQDPYVKEKIHAYQKFNEQKREFEAWIEIKLLDEATDEISTETLPLNRYVERRVLVYCPIVERKRVDRSYSIGEVEKKKEVGGILKGTGVMVDQEVEMYQEIFVVKTPSGKILTLADYVIC